LVFMYARLALREEQDALAEFGEEYGNYRQRTPAFFPRFSDKYRLAAAILFIATIPAAIAFTSSPDRNITSNTALQSDAAASIDASDPRGAEMNQARVRVLALKSQAQGLADTGDPVLRRDLIRIHLDEVHRINAASTR
ncbi:MAG: hypothetical protein JJE42_18870, partial [Burkholderiales bacterium]|nr:hypothetical protein [Burkholderiales bacterium]